MIKKPQAKLVGSHEQMTDFSVRTFKEKSAQESRDAAQRHDEIMDRRKKKYVSETTVPSEEQLRRPSNSVEKKED